MISLPSRPRSSADRVAEFVRVLADTPDLVEALLVLHEPGADRCPGADPCALWSVALEADREVQRRRRAHRFAAA